MHIVESWFFFHFKSTNTWVSYTLAWLKKQCSCKPSLLQLALVWSIFHKKIELNVVGLLILLYDCIKLLIVQRLLLWYRLAKLLAWEPMRIYTSWYRSSIIATKSLKIDGTESEIEVSNECIASMFDRCWKYFELENYRM